MKTVLKLVNRARKARGLKTLETMPRGDKAFPTSCPLARALRATAVTRKVVILGPRTAKKVAEAWGQDPGDYRGLRVEVALPEPLRAFVSDFDGGHYPELIAR